MSARTKARPTILSACFCCSRRTPLPFLRGSAGVERAWLRFTEWAADDWAVSQDSACSLSLAEALVRVARLGAAAQASPLMSHFVAASVDISVRVERLLSPAVEAAARQPMRIALCGAPGRASGGRIADGSDLARCARSTACSNA